MCIFIYKSFFLIVTALLFLTVAMLETVIYVLNAVPSLPSETGRATLPYRADTWFLIVSSDFYSSCLYQQTCISQTKTESSILNEALFFWLKEYELLVLKNNIINQVKPMTENMMKF